MYPPIYSTCAADATVQSLLGANPRIYPFGEAPQNVTKPYAVWQMIGGGPENFINQVPDLDAYTIQLDVYADTETSVHDAARAIRNAVEPVAHIVNFINDGRDPETNNYRYIFSIDWMVNR